MHIPHPISIEVSTDGVTWDHVGVDWALEGADRSVIQVAAPLRLSPQQRFLMNAVLSACWWRRN